MACTVTTLLYFTLLYFTLVGNITANDKRQKDPVGGIKTGGQDSMKS
jgi:hypothetical protein